MERQAITEALKARHEAFIARIHAMPAEAWERAPNGKWSPAQQLEHILRSVRPVDMAMGLPKWFLRMAFGKPKRPARTYEALVLRYQEKLAAGGRAPKSFVPKAVPDRSVERMSTDLRKLIDSLNRRVDKWTDKDLDTTLLPHPLLGKLTMREMLCFTIHHVQHHQRAVERGHG